MKKNPIEQNLSNLIQKSPEIIHKEHNKIVIFSDFHMGNGKSRDDFVKNSDMVYSALKDYYLPRNFSLVLNGDIEELQKFTLHQIRKAWDKIYSLFDQFNEKEKLFKIAGNHDSRLLQDLNMQARYHTLKSLKILHNNFPLFVYHGHQATALFENYNHIVAILLHFIVKPLGIKNDSVAHNNRKKYTVERRAYDFSRRQQIISILGHTHRPLFESNTRGDNLKFRLEYYLRQYKNAPDAEKNKLTKKIKKTKIELDEWLKSKEKKGSLNRLYSSELMIPCLFNSGCAVGKRGITCLEICDGNIALIHWFDPNVSRRHIKKTGHKKMLQLKDKPYYRKVIRKDDLDYIINCIKFLT